MELDEEWVPAKGRQVMRLMRVVWLTAILTGLVVAAPAAQAQMGNRERVGQALEETEAMIQRATDLAMEARNRQAGEYVKQAVEVQKLARQAFMGGRYESAMTRTRAARSLAEKALGLLLRPEEQSERVRLELEQTDEFLQAAREGMPPGAPEPVQMRLAAAAKKQARAWEMFHDGRLRPALRMTHSVRQTLRRMRDAMPGADPGEFRNHLPNVEEKVNAAAEAAAQGDPRAQRFAERAQQALAEAKRHADRGNFQAANRALTKANKFADAAMTGERTHKAFANAVKQYEAQMERLRARLADNPNDEATRLMNESQEHFRLAQRAAAGELDEMWRAGAEMRIAMRLLQQAGRLVD